jgi:hypothetical protein
MFETVCQLETRKKFTLPFPFSFTPKMYLNHLLSFIIEATEMAFQKKLQKVGCNFEKGRR